ncbi:MAG: ribbon-helix-helix domain-containing protein [Solirubrobacteraceae bacterium]|jgi:Arc/MetJ-type ribon-helix-helix transcriptional regulator
MAQLVARLDDKLVAAVDELVDSGVVGNRSEAMRMALERLVEEHRRRRIGEEIVEGYARHPETDEELAQAKQATRALIEEEPW